jgi:hypothetical protein
MRFFFLNVIRAASLAGRSLLYKMRTNTQIVEYLSTSLLCAEIQREIFLALVKVSQSSSLLLSQHSQHSCNRLPHSRTTVTMQSREKGAGNAHSSELRGTSASNFLYSECGEFLLQILELFLKVLDLLGAQFFGLDWFC